MDDSIIQQQLFATIKTKIPEHVSVADEIAKVLSISSDSVYRRMRGDKPVTLAELYKLCTHFQISVDQLMNIGSDAFLFNGRIINNQTFKFDEYLTNIVQNVAYMNSFNEKQFYYLCKDIPVFHHYQFREVAAFKYYFWMRTILQMPGFANQKVVLKDYPDELFALGKKSLELYNKLDSYELWNLESLNSTVRQIDFYYESDLFQSKEDVWIVYDSLEKLIVHLEKQAELGYKFDHEDPEKKPIGKYNIYFNEVLLLDNTLHVVLNNTKITYVLHGAVNFMVTRDSRYCDYMHNYIQNLMRKSTLISSVNEKERLRFFNRIKEKIRYRKQQLI